MMSTQEPSHEEEPDSPARRAALHLCEEASRHFREGHYDETVSITTKAIAQDPDCWKAYQLRAHVRLMLQTWPEFIADATEIIRLRPRDAEAYAKRAFAYNHVGQHERAIVDCNKAIELDSICADAYFQRGYALMKLGKHEEAENDARRSFLSDADPETILAHDQKELVDSLVDRGEGALEAGHYEDAVQAFSAALLEKPENVEARYLRGKAYLQLGRFQAASEDMVEAWRLQQERDRVARGYLVAAAGTVREKLWCSFPDGVIGRYEAIALAESLVKDPSLVAGERSYLGGFERTIVYRFEGEKIEVIDWVWTEEHKARPAQLVTLRLDHSPKQDTEPE